MLRQIDKIHCLKFPFWVGFFLFLKLLCREKINTGKNDLIKVLYIHLLQKM